jgi:drug/metabolite transporter (DMT)-like permease
MLPVWAWQRRQVRLDAGTLRSAAGGVVSLVAYAIVICSASISPMGPVSALRESSVVIAVVLGWLFLGEQFKWWRLVACLVVARGTECLGLRG